MMKRTVTELNLENLYFEDWSDIFSLEDTDTELLIPEDNGLYHIRKKQKQELASENLGKNDHRRTWTEIELILLNSFTILYYARHRSMKSSSKVEKKVSRASAAWETIHGKYEQARTRLNLIHKLKLPHRTAYALSKKWKSSCTTDSNTLPAGIVHLLEFIQNLNKNSILTCPENEFQRLRLFENVAPTNQ